MEHFPKEQVSAPLPEAQTQVRLQVEVPLEQAPEEALEEALEAVLGVVLDLTVAQLPLLDNLLAKE